MSKDSGKTDASDVLIALLHWRTLVALVVLYAIYRGIINGEQLMGMVQSLFDMLATKLGGTP